MWVLSSLLDWEEGEGERGWQDMGDGRGEREGEAVVGEDK